MNAKRIQPVRCVIYTRKSSEEGLEQDFNSLDAQFEACKNYIKSQQHEGWQLLDKTYSDGGFSGGTVDRPALQQLLADVKNNAVDMIVLYKMDRLTRSLLDFAQLIECFNQHDVGFVSITEHFNTANSVGRLTLNMLLSFAQFERELTAERIRDKIKISKQRGLWMGGAPLLGYDVVDRKLIINNKEARLVRLIFKRYLELGSVVALAKALNELGYCTKRYTNQQGEVKGGVPFTTSALYRMLKNPIFNGSIRHKEHVYPGEHEGIIDANTFDQVQQRLAASSRSTIKPHKVHTPALLKGLLYDGEGRALTPTFTHKNGHRYRYYTYAMDRRARFVNGLKYVAAGQVENLVLKQLLKVFQSPQLIVPVIEQSQLELLDARHVTGAFNDMAQLWSHLFPTEQARMTQLLLEKVIFLDEQTLRLNIRTQGIRSLIRELPSAPAALDPHDQARPADDFSVLLVGDVLEMTVGFQWHYKRGQTQIILPKGEIRQQAPALDKTLIQGIVDGFKWQAMLDRGEARTGQALAKRLKLERTKVLRNIRLTQLAPDIIESILKGNQPEHVTLRQLHRYGFPNEWQAQREQLGFVCVPPCTSFKFNPVALNVPDTP